MKDRLRMNLRAEIGGTEKVGNEDQEVISALPLNVLISSRGC